MTATFVVEQLVRIQELQLIQGESPESNAELKVLRKSIPPQVLGHADRLFAREKKAVAIIERNVCLGCRMGIPTGTILAVRHGTDLQLCGNCGRYLYLPPVPAEPPPALEAAKPKRKRAARKPKAEPAA